MRRVLERLTSFFQILRNGGKKHAPVFAFSLLVLGGIFVFGHHVSAETTTVKSTFGEILTIGFTLGTRLLGNILSYVVINTLLYAMNFSDIINAAPVVAGWVVVRDFTNLLFIIILLIISFGIIFGQDKYGKIEMLPQLFITAIAINFSRTIVGFLNDISMVFMQTFVKAFSAAGAGNFIDLFSVDTALDYTPAAPAGEQSTGAIDAVGAVVIANIAGFFTLLVATIILGYLAVIMMIRIVTLWILVIIAPLAWFMRLAKGWEGEHGTYDKWWKDLKQQLVMGPIMAFFIWLALATGSAASVEFTNSEVAGGKMGNSAFADNGSATTKSAIKAIIAVAILFKGLEIAQSQGGGKGAEWLGAAGARAKSMGKAGLKMATGATLLSAGARAGLRMSSNETAQRYGKATSLSAPLLSDVGKGIGKAAGFAQKAPVVGSFLQRQVARAAGTVSAKGAAMTKAQEEGYAKQVTSGAPEVKAETLKQLVSMDSSAQSPAQKVQMKELMKEMESDSKMLSKMSPEGMLAFKNAKEKDIKGMKDPKEQREAMHHFESFMAPNVHRLPQEEQAGYIAHLPTEFKAKISPEAITIDAKATGKIDDINKQYSELTAKREAEGKTTTVAEDNAYHSSLDKAETDLKKEKDRIETNARAVGDKKQGGSPVAMAKLMTSSPEAAGSVGSIAGLADVIRDAAATSYFKENHVAEMVVTPGVLPENMVAMVSGLTGATAKAVHDNSGTMASLNKPFEDWKTKNAESTSPQNAALSQQDASANLETFLTRVAAASESGKPLQVNAMLDTFGIRDDGGIQGDIVIAVNNMKKMAKSSQFPQAISAIPPQIIERSAGELEGVITMNHVVQMDKRNTESGVTDPNYPKILAAIAKIPGMDEQMRKHPTVSLNMPKA